MSYEVVTMNCDITNHMMVLVHLWKFMSHDIVGDMVVDDIVDDIDEDLIELDSLLARADMLSNSHDGSPEAHQKVLALVSELKTKMQRRPNGNPRVSETTKREKTKRIPTKLGKARRTI